MSMSISEPVKPSEYNITSKPAEASNDQISQYKSQSSSDKSASTTTQKYDFITKDGDTLSVSADAKKAASAKVVLSAATLANYSEGKIKQLYSQKEITKQQYDKALKSKVK